jgi:integrase
VATQTELTKKMAPVKITKRVVDCSEPASSRYTVFDSEIKGFGIRVYPSGKKSWIFEYRPGEGGRRVAKKRITIGSSSDFTPDKARKLAENLRAKTKTGHDPQADKAQQREAITLAELAEEFLERHVGSKRKLRTKEHYEDIVRRIVLPKLGKMKAKDLARGEVSCLHFALRQTPFQANRMLAVMSSMYTYAGKQGLVPEGMNPARGIEKYDEPPRERYLTLEELERLGTAIRRAETIGIEWSINPSKNSKHIPTKNRRTIISEHAAAALRLLLFTGCRLREILHLKWKYVDFERGLLILPTSKSGKKTVVLNGAAMSVLGSLTKVGVYVIAGDTAGAVDEKPRSDLKRPWALVSSCAGLEGVRLHDLRHNFGAFGAGGGMGLPIIGKLLGQKQPATTQRYAHLDADPLRKASNAIGNTIAAAMGEDIEEAEVLKFPRKGPNR